MRKSNFLASDSARRAEGERETSRTAASDNSESMKFSELSASLYHLLNDNLLTGNRKTLSYFNALHSMVRIYGTCFSTSKGKSGIL